MSDTKNIPTYAHRSTRVTKVPYAYGKVAGATGALTDGINVASVVHPSPGVYNITLTKGLLVTNRHVGLTLRDANAGAIAVTAQGLTTLTVRTFGSISPPSAADRDFEFSIDQVTS